MYNECIKGKEIKTMTKERRIALRLLQHYIDNMTYWEEEKSYYCDDDTNKELVNEEVYKILGQIIKRYNLNSI